MKKKTAKAKKKPAQFDGKVELTLSSRDLLEFIDFLKVTDASGAQFLSARKVKKQLEEFLIACIEGRNARPVPLDTFDIVATLDKATMSDIAFSGNDPDMNTDFSVKEVGFITKAAEFTSNGKSTNNEPS